MAGSANGVLRTAGRDARAELHPPTSVEARSVKINEIKLTGSEDLVAELHAARARMAKRRSDK